MFRVHTQNVHFSNPELRHVSVITQATILLTPYNQQVQLAKFPTMCYLSFFLHKIFAKVRHLTMCTYLVFYMDELDLKNHCPLDTRSIYAYISIHIIYIYI